jgi:hypothetical protein
MANRTDKKLEPPPSLANAMYPQLSQRVKELDKARARDRERLLRNLRELNARMRASR